MKSGDAHALNDQQLIENLRNSREEEFSLRFRHATGELENTSNIRSSRRDVARLLTIARERGIDVNQELAKFDREKKK